jgi:hypothetical protein
LPLTFLLRFSSSFPFQRKMVMNRYTTLTNSVKTLFRFHQSLLQLRSITTLHSFVSREPITTSNFHNFYYGSFRHVSSSPTRGHEEASVDNRVPATIITCFLGSGKVLQFFIIMSSFYYTIIVCSM